jgi:hypothetical protein
MRHPRSARRLALISALLLLGLTGCGGNAVRVTGRVVENGQPYRPGKAAQVELTFFSADPPLAFLAFLNADGTFAAEGADGKGLPPGTYKVALSSPGGSVFRGQFTRENTPLTVELAPNSTVDLTIDVGKKTLTR